ncbi:type II secretion system F family protein [Caulobacter segnis]|uniref:type II secretion system F family protein n=1 Tax=Caulobacter segnis TaxID=88688 RepID=UPI00240F9A1B|nr:type II secretion system F family protein [Caulobacter segnis]MDG2520730.1 type II secretion system F family protein [Caulobacter segnis]
MIAAIVNRPFEAGLWIVAVAAMAWGLRLMAQQVRVDERLHDLDDAAVDRAGFQPPRVLQVLSPVLLTSKGDREEIEANLAAAGYPANGALVFGALRLGLTVVGLAAGAFLAGPLKLEGSAAMLAAFCGAGAGFIGAKPILASRADARRRKILAELPFTLDVLLMMLESGVSLDLAFRSLAHGEGRAAPITREATVALVSDLQRGMAYNLALDRWAMRLGVTGAHELAEVFKQSLSQGTELARTLREFGEEFSERRLSSARESIGRKTTKMTVIMILCFIPSLLIMLAGPAIFMLSAQIEGVGR